MAIGGLDSVEVFGLGKQYSLAVPDARKYGGSFSELVSIFVKLSVKHSAFSVLC
jgi:hypothetical protein